MMRLIQIATVLSLVTAVIFSACQFASLHARPVPAARQKGLRF